MRAAIIIVVVLLLVGVLFGGKLVSERNELVTEREQVNRAFSDVDVQLQRRADLIPNLVNTVKGYATHEEKVYADIANARAALLNARTPGDRIAANNQLDGALGRLLAISENYPQLKANENFLRLQDELAGTENRIQNERRRYNETVQTYNRDLNLFPNNIAASLFGFHEVNDYFRAAPTDRAAPQVKF